MRGPRAITWQSILVGNSLISLAILVSGGTLGGYASDTDSGGSTVLGKSLVAVAIAGVVSASWAIIWIRWTKRGAPTHLMGLVPFLTFYAVNGAIYFTAVQWLDVTSTAPSGIGWPARLISSVAIALAWGVAFSLLLDSSDRFHARRRELLDEMVAAEVERLRESAEAARLRAALGASVDEILVSTRERLSTMEGSAAAEVVRSAASDLVRPLSHQPRESPGDSFPVPRTSGILRQWWEHPRMPPLATALLVSSQTTAESVRNFGGVWGPLASLGYVALLYVFLFTVDRIGRRWPAWNRVAYATGVLGALAMNLWFAEGLSPAPINVGDAVANVLVSAVYIVITSLFDAVRQARAGLIEAMTREVDVEELRTRALQRDMADAMDELARDLHGRVQTRLVVCAAELERASRVGDHEAVARALSEATAALEQATAPTSVTLDDVIQGWSSLLDVHFSAANLNDADLQRADVMAVIEEGLANAFRHGQASTVTITIDRLTDCPHVEIVDDGVGPQEGVSGMGTDVLTEVSRGRVWLDRQGGHTRLAVDLPQGDL